MMKRIATAIGFCLLVATAHAQVDRAIVSGVVTDAQGAAIAAGTVTVTNVATNVATTVKTNSAGNYLVVNLTPGQHLIEVEVPGLTKGAQSVILEVGQRARVDFSLGVGALAETVTVEEATRLLNTSQAALGAVIDQNAVAKLPLAIRNWDDLLALVPGVQGDRFTEQGGGTSFGRTGGVNVHGARALQNNFLLDGVDNNSISTNVQELTSQVSRPSVDAIQEFKVVTSPYSAEYGRSPGAAVSVSTKSGTNEIHGTAYGFYRNEDMDANDFFSERAGGAQAVERPEAVRGQPRRTGRQGQGLLLRGLREDAHHPRGNAPHPRAHSRRACRATSRARCATPSRASPSRETPSPRAASIPTRPRS